jgi:hypothetical protein
MLGKGKGDGVRADAVRDCSFSWFVPEVAGTYVVEVGLVPAQ